MLLTNCFKIYFVSLEMQYYFPPILNFLTLFDIHVQILMNVHKETTIAIAMLYAQILSVHLIVLVLLATQEMGLPVKVSIMRKFSINDRFQWPCPTACWWVILRWRDVGLDEMYLLKI